MTTCTSDQEETWGQEKEAAYRRWILRIVEWLQIEEDAEKRRVYALCVAEIGEIPARSSANTVRRLHEKLMTSRAGKRMLKELPGMCYYDQERAIRSLIRSR